MSITFPSGASRRVNRVILTATLAFGAAGLIGVVCLDLAVRRGNDLSIALIYGASLLACSLASYLYNMLETVPWRRWLRRLDHAAIFLLIAGTYTPFAARGLEGPFGMSLLAWIWSLAALGIALRLVLPKLSPRAFVGVYLAMGWIALAAIGDLLAQVPPVSLGLLAIGGLSYTVGALLFARDIGRWTDPVWHGCVLGGSTTHFAAVVALLVGA